MFRRDFWVDGDLSALLQQDLHSALADVDNLPAEQVLNSDPTLVIGKIVKKHERAPIVPNFDRREYGKAREAKSLVNDFGRTIEVSSLAVDVYLPVTGDTSVLRYRANSWSPSPISWNIEKDRLVLSVRGPDLDSELVKNEYEKSLSLLNMAIGWANLDVIQNRTRIAGEVNARLTARREALNRAKGIDEQLNM